MSDVKTNEFFYKPPSSSDRSRGVINVLQVLAIVLVVMVVMYLIILLPHQVDGLSMEPNFHDKEQLFTDKIINLFSDTDFGKSINYSYDRGDVVVFPFENQLLIKRIIAKEGDQIMLKDGRVFLNGKQLHESYLQDTVDTRMPFGFPTFQEGETAVVPNDSFFLMGDNRPNSKDSRFGDIGFVKREILSGRVFLRYWPLDRFGGIGRGETTPIE